MNAGSVSDAFPAALAPVTWKSEYAADWFTNSPPVRLKATDTPASTAASTMASAVASSSVYASRSGLRTDPPGLKDEFIGPGDVRLTKSVNHGQNFLDAVRTRRRSVSPVEVAVWSDTISHLSDIAIRTGRRIRWDPDRECTVGDAGASAMLDRAMRSPWHI